MSRLWSSLSLVFVLLVSPASVAGQDAPTAEPQPATDEAPPAAETATAEVDAPAEAATEAPANTTAPSESGDGLVLADPADVDVSASAPIYTSGGLFDAGVVIGLKAGGGFGQLTSPMGASFVGELELGYTLPLPAPVNRDLQLFVAGQYSGPSADETISDTDPRLPGEGSWSYDVTLQQAIVTVGALYRVPVPLDWLRPYAAAGGRVSMSLTQVSGESAGLPFGDNEETATNYGGYGALGADFFVGPGSILFELQFGYVPLDGKVLQNTNSGALNVGVGYRFFL